MFHIYHQVPQGSQFTGHLHTTTTREAANTWVPTYAALGYTGLYIVEVSA